MLERKGEKRTDQRFFSFFFFLAVLWHMQDLSSPNRYQTHVPYTGSTESTTKPPGKSPRLICLDTRMSWVKTQLDKLTNHEIYLEIDTVFESFNSPFLWSLASHGVQCVGSKGFLIRKKRILFTYKYLIK